MKDEEILNGVSVTVASLLSKSNSHKLCNGNVDSVESSEGSEVKFVKVLKSKWGTDLQGIIQLCGGGIKWRRFRFHGKAIA